MHRKLGTSELFAWLCDQVGSVNSVGIAFISGPLDERAVRIALDVLPQRHPSLRTRIEAGEDGPVLTSENVPPIPLRVEVRRSDDHWHAEAERELDNSLPWFEGPLVRATILKSANVSELLVTFCHVIEDGMSISYFIRDLLDTIGQIIEGKTPSIQPLPERPSLEDLLPKTVRGVRGSIRIAVLLGTTLLNIVQRPKKLPRDGDPFAKDRCPRFIVRSFSPEETGIFIDRCHEETTTVHGAICAAVLRAGAIQINNTSEPGPLTINCLSAINLRPFLHPPLGDEMGYFFSWAITAHRLNKNTELWDLAREISNNVHQSIKKFHPLVFVSLLDKFTPKNVSPDDFAKRASSIYSASILVTNMGQLKIPEIYGPLTLQKINLVGANKAFSEYFCVDVFTYRDALTINFVYTEPTMSQTRAGALTEDTMRLLKSAIHVD